MCAVVEPDVVHYAQGCTCMLVKDFNVTNFSHYHTFKTSNNKKTTICVTMYVDIYDHNDCDVMFCHNKLCQAAQYAVIYFFMSY